MPGRFLRRLLARNARWTAHRHFQDLHSSIAIASGRCPCKQYLHDWTLWSHPKILLRVSHFHYLFLTSVYTDLSVVILARHSMKASELCQPNVHYLQLTLSHPVLDRQSMEVPAPRWLRSTLLCHCQTSRYSTSAIFSHTLKPQNLLVAPWNPSSNCSEWYATCVDSTFMSALRRGTMVSVRESV